MTRLVSAPREPVIGRARSRALVFSAAIGMLVLAVTASLALGSRPIELGALIGAFASFDPTSTDHVVVRELRVPRTIIGIVAGIGFAVAGALMQSITRNPLADPGLLGINAGASLAVVLGIAVLGVASGVATVVVAIIGAAVAAGIVMLIAATAKRVPGPLGLVLAGTALSAAATSIVTLVLVTDLDTLAQFRLWVAGSLVGRGLDVVAVAAPLVAIGIVAALALGPGLSALALGDAVATGLGERIARTRVLAAAAVVLLCGAATAVAGPIVFVGLVVPHLARRLAGASTSAVIALSIVLGPVLLLSADLLGRFIARPGELEAGIVVALVGAPLLIAIAVGRRARAS